MNINKIGLEAEFLLRKEGKFVYPSDHGFQTDDFIILGEFRGEPGATREEAIANFLKVYYNVAYKAKALGLTIDMEGFAKIAPKEFAEILRKIKRKEIVTCQNVYNTDILTLNDDEIVDGKIVNRFVSCGLHIHFSSSDSVTKKVTVPSFDSVKIPIKIGDGQSILDLFSKAGETVQEVSVHSSRITKPVIEHFVRSLDKDILPDAVRDLPNLKYRNRGFYEIKGYGFEYRSLPFTQRTMSVIGDIVGYSFNLLENL